MTDLLLSDILTKVSYQHLYKRYDYPYYSSVCFDSRQAKPGQIFVALKGLQYNGHDYIQEALANGAGLIIAENDPATDCPVSWIKVPDSRLALAQLAAGLFEHPSRELTLTGVTGTCGKTTTSSMLRFIYETAGHTAGLIGTVNIHCSDEVWPAKITTPDVLEVQRLLRLMVDRGVTHVAMEVSSHSLAQKRVAETTFQAAIFTNISPNHLDYHRDMEDYLEAKKSLATLVPANGFILANGNEPYFRELQDSATAPVFFVGEDSTCDVAIDNVALDKQGSAFDLIFQNAELRQKLPDGKPGLRLHTPLLGKHNVFNAAFAATAALLTGAPVAKIAEGLATFHGVERRMQVYSFGDWQIIDDTAMNEGSINAVFNTIRDLSISKLAAIYSIRGSRGTQVNEDNGKTLARWAKRLKVNPFVSTNSISHVDENNKVFPSEQEAFIRGVHSEGITVEHFMELTDAIAYIMKNLSTGTTLLLLGAQGMDEGLNIIRDQTGYKEAPAEPVCSS